jgi:hypothetical protein
MPAWVQVIGAITALLALLAALWSKVLRPGAGLITSTEEMLPLLRELTSVFRDSPGVFHVLNQIAAQFRTDSGSSLRDVVNRLEAAAVENRNAGEALKVGVEASRLLSERDRQQLDRLIVLLDRLTIRVDALAVSGVLLAEDRANVASDLVAREEKLDAATAGVASDLAASQQRAAGVDTGDTVGTGAAADAAALPPPTTSGGPFIPADATADEAREIVAAWVRSMPGGWVAPPDEEGDR